MIWIYISLGVFLEGVGEHEIINNRYVGTVSMVDDFKIYILNGFPRLIIRPMFQFNLHDDRVHQFFVQFFKKYRCSGNQHLSAKNAKKNDGCKKLIFLSGHLRLNISFPGSKIVPR